jgi:hypothetical protein
MQMLITESRDETTPRPLGLAIEFTPETALAAPGYGTADRAHVEQVDLAGRRMMNMSARTPPKADDVKRVVEERLKALEGLQSAKETVTIEWRGSPLHIPVISMPVALLSYNPDTHRIRAQRSTDPSLEKDLHADPFGASAQQYLHGLLMGDPSNPSTVDPSFLALKDDLKDHGQSEPGIITRSGVLINGNTRQAALREIGETNIRVGVLPPDAAYGDIEAIELSLQLRRDHKRDYSFMNFLLAVDERAAAGQPPGKIQADFRIKATTYERMRWILDFVREAIDRSKVTIGTGTVVSLRLVDFEAHQGKLEELYRAYISLRVKSPDEAEALREQRLLALVMQKSKTDLRLIEPDFVQKYTTLAAPEAAVQTAAPVRIPGTSIRVPGPSTQVQALSDLTTRVLRARAVALTPGAVPPTEVSDASELLSSIEQSLNKGLDHAGRHGRVIKRRIAPADRLSDACEDLNLAVAAVAEARGTGNFDAADLDDSLTALRTCLEKLSAIVARGGDESGDGVAWLRSVGRLQA